MRARADVDRVQLRSSDPGYPSALLELPSPPEALSLSAPLEAARAVAIVGSRTAEEPARAFAHYLAAELAEQGVVVVSGGAVGIDTAAHEGAMSVGGATWVVAPTGKDHVFPEVNRDLFARVAASERGRVLWPFPPDRQACETTFRFRNAVLVALSEAIVIVQAMPKSGSRNAASWARSLGRALWVVPASPWMPAYQGSLIELDRGARPLCHPTTFFKALGLPAPTRPMVASKRTGRPSASHERRKIEGPSKPLDTGAWSPEEIQVYSGTSRGPKHIDAIGLAAGTSAQTTATALLTLSLKNVVVEGPDGFFRRRIAG